MDTAFAVWLLSRSGETAGSYFPSHRAGVEPEFASFGGMVPLPVLIPSEGGLGSFASSFAFRRNNPLTAIPKTTQAITFNSLWKIYYKIERAECKLCFDSIVLTPQDSNQSEVLVPTSELKCDTM